MNKLMRVSLGCGILMLITASVNAAPAVVSDEGGTQVAQGFRSRGSAGFPDWDSRSGGYDRSRRPEADTKEEPKGKGEEKRGPGGPGGFGPGKGGPGGKGIFSPPWARGGDDRGSEKGGPMGESWKRPPSAGGFGSPWGGLGGPGMMGFGLFGPNAAGPRQPEKAPQPRVKDERGPRKEEPKKGSPGDWRGEGPKGKGWEKKAEPKKGPAPKVAPKWMEPKKSAPDWRKGPPAPTWRAPKPRVPAQRGPQFGFGMPRGFGRGPAFAPRGGFGMHLRGPAFCRGFAAQRGHRSPSFGMRHSFGIYHRGPVAYRGHRGFVAHRGPAFGRGPVAYRGHRGPSFGMRYSFGVYYRGTSRCGHGGHRMGFGRGPARHSFGARYSFGSFGHRPQASWGRGVSHRVGWGSPTAFGPGFGRWGGSAPRCAQFGGRAPASQWGRPAYRRPW